MPETSSTGTHRSTEFRSSGLLLAFFLLAGFAGVYFLSNAAEARRTPVPESYIDDDLSLEGRRLKGFVFGAEGLMADVYWMQSLQYLGDKFVNAPADQVINLDDLRPLNPRLLYPYLDNATELDPSFIAAYSYGATVLPAIDPEMAIKLTEKGIANNPTNFRLYQYLGYIYWKLHRYDEAASAYERGAAQPGAPSFMLAMAAFMKGKGGSRETARAMYRQMYETGDQQTQMNAQYRLDELNTEAQLDAINEKLASERETSGKCVQSLKSIVAALASVKLTDAPDFRVNSAGDLVDPKGTPYILDTERCRARSNNFRDAGKEK